MPGLLSRSLFVSLALAYTSSYGASLQIAPVSIQLSGTEAGKALTLRSDGDQPIHAQVRTYAWTQTEDGDQLAPTRELVASPPIGLVPAGGEQVIRVIRADQNIPTAEHAYRLIIDELPPEGSAAGTAVQFRFRYSVSLFVSPSADVTPPELAWSVVEKRGSPYLRVVNRGAVHARLSDVTITSGTTPLPVASGLLGYVLPGHTRSWSLARIAHALHGGPGEVGATVNRVALKATLARDQAP
ncbi:Sigma-fimbriae chaperone protein [Candidatus Burkholderia humilis]|nr:Sigma-fimbriae chaperone protein [Candidatus Burkholderia humilis]